MNKKNIEVMITKFSVVEGHDTTRAYFDFAVNLDGYKIALKSYRLSEFNDQFGSTKMAIMPFATPFKKEGETEAQWYPKSIVNDDLALIVLDRAKEVFKQALALKKSELRMKDIKALLTDGCIDA